LWWQKLMDKLSAQISDYLIAQINAGAKAIQIFDSWVGSLSPYDFRDYVLPHLQKIVKHIKEAHPELPVIYFSTSTGSYLPLIKEIGADVISVDWRIDILEAWEKLDNEPAIQGNLEPSLLLGPVETMHQQTARLLDAVGSRPGHIMNLGHGIHKETNPDNIASFVNFVHEHSKRD
ncbi:MAG: uroporphyrinogen decarboxylase, partial [Lentisphaeria bacterium]|nr:uroporphyrinogen decarboxylase [Lentisphaeria bacterium]NQZ69711.1 uroporphyrinogen decarboxylase [Lentisphaeria bacterium]